MKRKIFLTLSITILMNLLCFANENLASKFKANLTNNKIDLWTKNVWSILEISDSTNEALFYPYNESRIGFNNFENDYDLDLLESQKSAIQFNLWNILMYHFLRGELTLHFPYDPNWYLTIDQGFLFYPITSELYGTSSKGTYFIDSLFRQNIKDFQLFGAFNFDGPRILITSIAFPGEDSINAEGNTLYYPREFNWYFDKDILHYQIKESWIIDDSGLVMKKNIEAIAPVINLYDTHGNLMGLKELFWLDFEQLEPLLTKYFFVKKDESAKKVLSFSDFFLDRKFDATVIREDSFYVKKQEK